MKVYMWTLIVLFALTAMGKLIHLVKETGPRMTPRGCDAFDIVLDAAFIAWALVLLQ